MRKCDFIILVKEKRFYNFDWKIDFAILPEKTRFWFYHKIKFVVCERKNDYTGFTANMIFVKTRKSRKQHLRIKDFYV